MVQITKHNYHSLENKAISTTKVKDYLKSKELYFRRYIEGSEPSLDTPSIKMGRIIDKILDQMTLHFFQRSYRRAVLKRDDPDEFNRQKTMDKDKVLPPAVYDAIVGISEKALRAPFLEFYRDRKVKTEKQKVMVQSYKDIEICGMLDRFSIYKNTVYIDDYKTSSSGGIKSPESWAFVCERFGYFMQMAVYRWLVEQEYPEIEHVVCRHVIFGTNKADMYPIKLFIIPYSLLEEPLKLFFETVQAITEEQEWVDKLPDWSDAIELPEILASAPPDIVGDEEMNTL